MAELFRPKMRAFAIRMAGPGEPHYVMEGSEYRSGCQEDCEAPAPQHTTPTCSQPFKNQPWARLPDNSIVDLDHA
jgi:hypothetical protein